MGPGTEAEVYAKPFWERTVQGGKTRKPVQKARQELAVVTLGHHCRSDEHGQTLNTWENERMNGSPPVVQWLTIRLPM